MQRFKHLKSAWPWNWNPPLTELHPVLHCNVTHQDAKLSPDGFGRRKGCATRSRGYLWARGFSIRWAWKRGQMQQRNIRNVSSMTQIQVWFFFTMPVQAQSYNYSRLSVSCCLSKNWHLKGDFLPIVSPKLLLVYSCSPLCWSNANNTGMSHGLRLRNHLRKYKQPTGVPRAFKTTWPTSHFILSPILHQSSSKWQLHLDLLCQWNSHVFIVWWPTVPVGLRLRAQFHGWTEIGSLVFRHSNNLYLSW